MHRTGATVPATRVVEVMVAAMAAVRARSYCPVLSCPVLTCADPSNPALACHSYSEYLTYATVISTER